MPDQGLLDTNTQPTAPVVTTTTPPVVDPIVQPLSPPADELLNTQLATIVNKDGQPKYESVPKALDALASSQSHIATLEVERETQRQELSRLNELVAKHESVEDVVARLTAERHDPVKVTPEPTQVDPSTVLPLVQQALAAERVAVTQAENIQAVTGAIAIKYGDKAREFIEQRAQEFDMTIEQVKTLAAGNPKLVLKMFEVEASSPSSTTSSISLPSLPAPTGVEAPVTSALQGPNSGRTQVELMKAIRDDVYKKHDITT